MPLVAAKCTQCGANLQVESSNDAANCTYCGTPFITEKAINNYNTTINVNEGGVTADTLIEHANILLKDGSFSKATEIFDKVLERAPRDHRAHWGKMQIKLGITSLSDDALKSLINKLYRAKYVVFPTIDNLEETMRNFELIVKHIDEDAQAFVSEQCSPHYNNALEFAINKKSKYVDWYNGFIAFTKEAAYEQVNVSRSQIEAVRYQRDYLAYVNHEINQKIEIIDNRCDFLQRKINKNENRAETLSAIISIGLILLVAGGAFISVLAEGEIGLAFVALFVFGVIAAIIVGIINAFISFVNGIIAKGDRNEMQFLGAEKQKLDVERQQRLKEVTRAVSQIEECSTRGATP